MEAGTAESKQAEERDPRVAQARERSGGDKGREMLEHAAQGAKLDEDEERAGLDYLLGAKAPMVHEIDVDYETPSGMAKLVFVMRTIDARKIDEIEQRHVNRATGSMDRLSADTEIVAEATDSIVDATGREVKLRSDEFLTVRRDGPRGMEDFKHAAPPLALEERFRDQLGLMTPLALEVRRVCGFTSERISQAKRRLVSAALD